MKIINQYFIIIFALLFSTGQVDCTTRGNINPRLVEAPKVADDLITEASGLVASRINPDIFWTHNDSGDSAVIFAVGADGSARGRFILNNCRPRDIEDITIGIDAQSGISYIYLGDIGDNAQKRKLKQIYKFREPKINKSTRLQYINDFEIINFEYPDFKKYDAETLLFDPFTQDLIVITKRDRKSNLKADRSFILTHPQKVDGKKTAIKAGENIEVPTAQFVGYGITGGDISADGCQIILKTYTNIYYWQRKSGESFKAFFKQPYTNLLYSSQEGQGEAVCFTLNGNAYRTIAEESLMEAYLSLYQLRK